MKSRIPETLEETYTITSADTDFKKKLTVSSLINMFIQSAWHHAESLGFGMDFLHENGTIWMVFRLHVKFYQTPFWNEKLVMTTWPKGIHRVFYQRDFEALDVNRKKIAEGTSEFMIIDLKSKRPKLFQADHHIFNQEHIRHAIDSHVPVLITPEVQAENFMREVRYSDIDLNEHLTTTRYIDWMFDSFNLEFLNAHSCKEIIVNFIREIPIGTVVKIVRYPMDETNSFLFEFLHPEQNHLFFRGQLIF